MLEWLFGILSLLLNLLILFLSQKWGNILVFFLMFQIQCKSTWATKCHTLLLSWSQTNKSSFSVIKTCCTDCFDPQSFETPTPGVVGVGAGTFTWCECESQWSSPKILSDVPVPGYSAVQTKVPCVESAVTAFLKSSHQTLKSISKRRKREHELCK